MIPQMIIRVGNRHVKNDSFPQLSQVRFGIRAMRFDEGRNIKVTHAVFSGSAIRPSQ
jgi:hypothetical protein